MFMQKCCDKFLFQGMFVSHILLAQNKFGNLGSVSLQGGVCWVWQCGNHSTVHAATVRPIV